MSNIILHIGLHKTGTTFLQENIFKNLEAYHYSRMSGSFMSNLWSPIGSNNLLISNENLSGRPWIKSFSVDHSWFDHYQIIIANLSIFFPNAKVIIGFREHKSMILSLYKQFLHVGGTKSFSNFFHLDSNFSIIKKHDVFYMDRLQYLYQYFPKENVFIYTQEDLKDDLQNTLSKLGIFMECDLYSCFRHDKSKSNIGVKRIPANILRHLNKIDRFLISTKILPTLNNRIFKKLNISPRELCQYRLNSLFSENLTLENEMYSAMEDIYSKDWQLIQAIKSTKQ